MLLDAFVQKCLSAINILFIHAIMCLQTVHVLLEELNKPNFLLDLNC